MKKNQGTATLNVLVVDDDENIRMVLQKAIGKQGHHVSVASNGEEALEILQRSHFHVVITDIQMGEMSGLELMEEIKELNALIQIYVVTAHSNLERVISCMKGGAYDFFEKPIQIEDVLTTIQEAARRTQRWSQLYSKYLAGIVGPPNN